MRLKSVNPLILLINQCRADACNLHQVFIASIISNLNILTWKEFLRWRAALLVNHGVAIDRNVMNTHQRSRESMFVGRCVKAGWEVNNWIDWIITIDYAKTRPPIATSPVTDIAEALAAVLCWKGFDCNSTISKSKLSSHLGLVG